MFSGIVGVLDCSSTLLSLRAITIEPSDTIESLIVLIFRLTVEILCPTFVAKSGRVQYILILEFFETKLTFYSEFCFILTCSSCLTTQRFSQPKIDSIV